jgi:hypothetical protein
MRFYVKCVRCGRIAGVSFIEPVSTTEEELLEQPLCLGGYAIKCPACAQRRQPENPLPLVRSAVAASLTEAMSVTG